MPLAASDPRAFIGRVLPGHGELLGTVEELWSRARRNFPGHTLESWLQTSGELEQAGLGSPAMAAYLRAAAACAEFVGPNAAIGLAGTSAALARAAGKRAAEALLSVASKAARRLAEPEAFTEWLGVIETLAALAPESLAPLLDRVEGVLAELDVTSFRAWALAGVRAAGGDAGRRLDYFTFVDPEARRWLHREADDVVFSHLERRLKAYLVALWGLRPPIRTPTGGGTGAAPRRISFDRPIIRVPESFRGFAGQHAIQLYRAGLAHAAAHLLFSGDRFPVASLKPVQVALVSLVEDARVEHLAMGEYPGLRRLWLPFHVAAPSGALTASILMARLARALIDPAYEDDNAWVRKGRRLFFDARDQWEDPTMSRTIGGLLGNDLGQMRVQFNARTYVVEPPYRDDNMGLWDFGDAAQNQEQMEVLFESVRVEQIDGDGEPREDTVPEPPEEDVTGSVKPPDQDEQMPDEAGVPVARYPEWDYLIGRERPDWTTILECPAEPGRAAVIDWVLEQHPVLVYQITGLIRSAKVSRPVRLRRQPEGERLDLDACIEAAISRRMRKTPDPRVYATSVRRHRDLSVLVLLDVSESTKDLVLGGSASVLSLERDAAALLAHAMAGLDDPFAIHAFCSNGREEVRYLRIKDFAQPYGETAKARLAGLSGGLSTRIGAALRHAGGELAQQLSHRRLLLVVTDGEPSDVDVADRRYLVEDARKAVASINHLGVDVFCVGLDSGGDSYLTRIFGPRNVLLIDRLQRLPDRLTHLFFRLTK